jgi:hypothetical protein
MKKTLFLLLLLPLLGRGLGGGCLFAQNTIDVSGLKVETAVGSPSTVTFNVKWSDPGAPNLWSDTVWVFVDYNKNGKMTRLELLPLSAGATLTATSSPGVGKLVEENIKGMWVVGDARTNGSFSATVQLLTATADLYGVCAYASSYPPVAHYVSASKIVFAGTPMYEIWLTSADGFEMIESSGTFLLPCSYTMSSFTDATGAPGKISCIQPTAYTLSGADVCEGAVVTLTLAGSQSGWQYQLYNGTTTVGGIVPGTDGALVFTDAAAAVGGHTYSVQTVGGAGERCDVPASNEHGITVNLVPTGLSLSAAPAEICAGQTVTLTAVVAPISGASYSIDNSMWHTTPAIDVTPGANTTYTLYVKTEAGCSATKTDAALVTVNPLGADGELATACGCAEGTTDCGGRCYTTTGTYTTNDGACAGCHIAYVQQRDQCGEVLNATYSTSASTCAEPYSYTNDGACFTCGQAYRREKNACGEVTNAQAGSYYNWNCWTQYPPMTSACKSDMLTKYEGTGSAEACRRYCAERACEYKQAYWDYYPEYDYCYCWRCN